MADDQTAEKSNIKPPARSRRERTDDHGLRDGPDATDRATGPEVIKSLVKTLPPGPGVYRMLDHKGDVLYVGKARSLKKRVQSYTRLIGHTSRIAKMILSTADMEFVTTASEADALLLEANLIKRLKPRFNVVLRDDKSHPYILLTGDGAWPMLVKHRGARSRPSRLPRTLPSSRSPVKPRSRERYCGLRSTSAKPAGSISRKAAMRASVARGAAA